MFAAQLRAALGEAQGGGKLSGVRKKPAPHMWFIAKTGKNAWVVSIGDPTKTSSRTKRTFHSKDDLRYWVKHEKEVSDDHIIDRSGLKLVPDYYSQWYVDNMMKKESVDLEEARSPKTLKMKGHVVVADSKHEKRVKFFDTRSEANNMARFLSGNWEPFMISRQHSGKPMWVLRLVRI